MVQVLACWAAMAVFRTAALLCVCACVRVYHYSVDNITIIKAQTVTLYVAYNAGTCMEQVMYE